MVPFPEKMGTGLCEENHEFSFGHGEFELTSAHPREDAKSAVGATM